LPLLTVETQFVLVCEKSLKSFPKRPTDGSYVLRNRDLGEQKKTFYRWNARPDKKPVLIKRFVSSVTRH
jgi:hypothetical protein